MDWAEDSCVTNLGQTELQQINPNSNFLFRREEKTGVPGEKPLRVE